MPLSTAVFKTAVIDHSTISPVPELTSKRVQRYDLKLRIKNQELRIDLYLRSFNTKELKNS